MPLNINETQVFALDQEDVIISPSSNGIWDQSHRKLVGSFLDQATRIEITQRCEVMTGVYHFGHTIADQLETLFMHTKNRAKPDKPPILLFNSDPVIYKLLRLLEIEPRFQKVTISCPTVLICNGLVDLIEHAKESALCTSTMSTIAAYTSKRLDFYLNSSLSLQRYTGLKVLLSSQSHSRITNRSPILPVLQSNGWFILDPLTNPLISTLVAIRNASRLISENGSILFNVFLARENKYQVLSSERVAIGNLQNRHQFSGGRYNMFHSGLMEYIPCKMVCQSTKHPFADLLSVCPDLFD